MPADRFKAAAARGRAAAARVEQRPTTVSVVTETWTGNVGTDGAVQAPGSPATVTLAPNPDVNVTAWQPSAFGGGRGAPSASALVAAEVRVGPVTPAFAGGGYDTSTLAPPTSDATQRVYLVLAGGQFDDAGERFDLARVECPTPQSTYLICTRTAQT